jgi:hypothetical protein
LPLEVPDGKPPTTLVGQALGHDPWMRVALVCEAGLGKTTNMRWLRAHLAMPGTRVLLFLLQLHTPELGLLLREGEQAGFLLDHLARQLAGNDKNTDRHLHHLKKLKAQGRITLLIDGLDHGLSQVANLTDILNTILENWKNCPVWISGRPSAFSLAWPLVQHGNWRFLRVEGLHVPDIRFYFDEQVEPEEMDRTKKGDWYSALPEDGRELLEIPRFLHLVAGELRDEVAAAQKSGADPLHAIEELDLHTRADVYRLAYFSRGEDVSPRGQIAGKDDDREKRGLIAQGLDACYPFEDGQSQYLGQKKGEPKDDKKLARRIRFAAGLLGAIAFEMYANPHKYGARESQGKDAPLQPNTASIPETEMDAFEDAVRARLLDADARRVQALAASPIFKPEYIENAFLILGANNRTVDYVMFHEVGEKGLAWHDPTVQAFFAAYWAMNYATPKELEAMKAWRVVRSKDERGREILLGGFDEFWQFTAEMPDQLLHAGNYERWFTTIEPSYAPPQVLEGDNELVQWHRRMIYYSCALLEQRSLQTKDEELRKRAARTTFDWRAVWLTLKAGNGTKEQQAIIDTIQFRDCPPTQVVASFLMGSPENEVGRYVNEIQRDVVVKPFAMQDFLVTNAQFELFDPTHRERRNKYYSDRDEQPVTYVTFWDAWNFAKWTGNRLPTEVEWEYACRAGTTTRFHFGDDISYRLCNYGGNITRTTAKGEFNYPENDWKLFDMHGNVWEWCNTRFEPGAPLRVLRGGSWDTAFGADFRSARRFRAAPVQRSTSFGFRLAAVPALEPSEARARSACRT